MSAYDNNIVLFQDQILLRQNGKSVPKEQVDVKLFGLFEFLDCLSCILLIHKQFCDFPDICTVVIQNATLIADLYDVKDFLFYGMSFLKLRYTLL